MKFRAILLSALCCLALTAMSQQLQETVYLKNGTVVTGTIVEFVPNETITIVTENGNRFVFALEDIAKVTRTLPEEPEAKPVPDAQILPSKNLFGTGYRGLVETGMGAAMGSYGIDVFKLDFINGYRFNNYLFVGGGIGYRKIMAKDGLGFLPLFANVRANLPSSGAIVPFASVNLGVAFNSADGLNEGGALINPSFGIYISSNRNYMLHASVGYDAMQMPFFVAGDFWSSYLQRRIRYSEAFTMHIGVSF